MEKFQLKGLAKSIDVEKRTVEFIITKEVIDRDGDIIAVAGGNFENYKKNPVVQVDHHWSAQFTIGKAISLEVVGDEIHSTAYFAKGDELSEKIFNLIVEGCLNAVSIGFSSKKWEFQKMGEKHVSICTDWELLEYSVVAIPANPEALAKSVTKGIISQDEAKKLWTSKNSDDSNKTEEDENLEKLNELKEAKSLLKHYRKAFVSIQKAVGVEGCSNEQKTIDNTLSAIGGVLNISDFKEVETSDPAKQDATKTVSKASVQSVLLRNGINTYS